MSEMDVDGVQRVAAHLHRSDDEQDVIPDTPSPVFMGKNQRRVAQDNKDQALPKKIKLLVDLDTSKDDLVDLHPRSLPSQSRKQPANRKSERLLLSDVIMDTDSDSAISSSNQEKKGSVDNQSGDDGDLSSDLEPPDYSRRNKTKKSPAKIKHEYQTVDFSDDSDFDIFPSKSRSNSSENINNSKEKVMSNKEKKKQRRSLLPPLPDRNSESGSPNSPTACQDYAMSVFAKLKRRGKFFPSLSTSPAAAAAAASIGEDKCIVLSDDKEDADASCLVDLSQDVSRNHEAGSASSNTSPPFAKADTKPQGGARPKTRTHTRTRLKHPCSSAMSGSNSDSLLSPPKKSKAAYTREEKKLAERNSSRMETEQSSSSTSPCMQQHSASPSYRSNGASPAAVKIDWDSPVPMQAASAMSTDSDDLSDLAEGEWEEFICNMSKRYLPKRVKKTAKRRSCAAVSENRSIPDIVVIDVADTPAFNLSPSFSFTNSDQAVSFTGKRSQSESKKQDMPTVTPAVWNSADYTQNGTVDSPLDNMIVDMAIQDVDFDAEMIPSPPRNQTANFLAFQPASSLLSEHPGSAGAGSAGAGSAGAGSAGASKPNKTSKRNPPSASVSFSSPPQEGSTSFTQGQGLHVSSRRSSRGQRSRERRLRRSRVSDILTDSFDDVIMVGSTDASGRAEPAIESDEAMARRLQEEMDREFAARLAGAPVTPGPPQASSFSSRPHAPRPPHEETDHEFAARLAGAPVPSGLSLPAQSASTFYSFNSNSSSSRRPHAPLPQQGRGEHQRLLNRLTEMPEYDFSVLCAIAEGRDIPPHTSGQQRSLEDIVCPELLAFLERTGLDYVRSERAYRTHVPELAGFADEAPRRPTRTRNTRNARMRADEAMAQILGTSDYYGDTSFPPPPFGGSRFLASRREAGGLLPPLDIGENYEELLALGERLGDAKPKGLSKEQIQRLPLRTFHKNPNVSLGSKEAECNVCCCEYEEGDEMRILPCFHKYHSQCVDNWIKRNPTCPVCRVDIQSAL